MKCLYLGLFSRKPNNLFADNYAELRSDLLQGLYKHDSDDEERIFGTVFLIVSKSNEASDVCKTTFSGHDYEHFFKRFHDPDKPRYRAYIAILAICGALAEDLSKRSSEASEEVARMEQFLKKTKALLENNYSWFERCYLLTYEVLASFSLQAWTKDRGSDSHVAQEMYKRLSQAPFDAFYAQLRMRIDADKRLNPQT
jgi:hypothetical protein